jgi:two-component system, chemotaxis family, protein-glutamate methylesterase/glutaminase
MGVRASTHLEVEFQSEPYCVKRIIVVGGSAGGIKALCTLLEGIPRKFPAPILAVIHLGEESQALSQILQRCSALKVVDPAKAEPIRAGRVYIAPPNRHLLVRSGCAMAVMGPRENRHRPSVDALFRSTARSYRGSVIAVVLSGALDDGSAGAVAVKSRGGMVIVQDPNDAEVRYMPANVIRHTKADHCVKLKEIAPLLKRLVAAKGFAELPETAPEKCHVEFQGEPVASENEPIAFTCPECGGALLQINGGGNTQLRCHVGHRYSLDSFTEAHADAVERAVWVALRTLRERQVLNEQVARDSARSAEVKKRFKENASAAAHDIKMLEEVLTRL